LHKGLKVPVGKDQEQHLEMARTFGNRFNRLYNVEYFPEPQAFNYDQNLVKVPGLTGQGKMSKSAGEADSIYMSDSEEVMRKKVMKAVTASVDGPTDPGSAKPLPIQNLFDLMGLVCSSDVIAKFEADYYEGSIRFGDLKKQLADDMNAFLDPYRNKINDVLADDALLSKVAKLGAEKASESANKTISEVREIIGFKRFY
jgi:tryptophanyl-tRNA synthetase